MIWRVWPHWEPKREVSLHIGVFLCGFEWSGKVGQFGGGAYLGGYLLCVWCSRFFFKML